VTDVHRTATRPLHNNISPTGASGRPSNLASWPIRRGLTSNSLRGLVGTCGRRKKMSVQRRLDTYGLDGHRLASIHPQLIQKERTAICWGVKG